MQELDCRRGRSLKTLAAETSIQQKSAGCCWSAGSVPISSRRMLRGRRPTNLTRLKQLPECRSNGAEAWRLPRLVSQLSSQSGLLPQLPRLVSSFPPRLIAFHNVLRVILRGGHLVPLDMASGGLLPFHSATGLALARVPFDLVALLQVLRHCNLLDRMGHSLHRDLGEKIPISLALVIGTKETARELLSNAPMFSIG